MTRKLYATVGATLLLAAALAILVMWPGVGLKPARRTAIELDIPVSASAHP